MQSNPEKFCGCGEKFSDPGILGWSEDLTGEGKEIGRVGLPFSPQGVRFIQLRQQGYAPSTRTSPILGGPLKPF